MRKRKFIKGERLTMQEALQHVLDGRYVFQHNKPQHPGWILSWPISLLRGFCAHGCIYEAKLNPEYGEHK